MTYHDVEIGRGTIEELEKWSERQGEMISTKRWRITKAVGGFGG